MIGLSDVINLIWVDGDKPIRIITENGETPKDRDSDSTDELESTVLGINIYDDYVEIKLGEWNMNAEVEEWSQRQKV